MAEDRDVVDRLESVWSSFVDLCDSLTESEWEKPTDCPGWTVKDQLAHVLGTESSLAGDEVPSLETKPDHVRNELGAFNEAWVRYYRDMPGPDLIPRFRDVTTRRSRALRAMSDEQLRAASETPVGTMPYVDFMWVRLLDCWVHEQDVRHATGRPGGFQSSGAASAIEKLLATLGFVVGKKVKPPEGTVITLHIHGPMERVRSVEVIEGRGKTVRSDRAASSTVVTDVDTFARLAAGRWSAEYAVDAGLVKFEHDAELGRGVVANLASMP